MKNSAIAFLLCTILTLSSCWSTGGPPSDFQKYDQFIGSILTYEASAHTQADKEALFTSALSVLGLDLEGLNAVVPSATGIQLATMFVQKNPDLAPYADLLAKLYTVAVYGLPAAPTSPTAKSVVEIAPSAEVSP